MELTNFVKKYSGRGGALGTPWAGANGVYVVSPACPTQFWEGERCGNNVPMNVKIGKASGENGFATADGKGRLQAYRTYWPNGVTVHAVLITPSFDRTVHTYKDEALKRETTLRRIFNKLGLVGFGSNGHGGDNGTRHLGSEWIHLTPSKMMNFLIAAGPYRHANDKLYGCTKDKCERVHTEKVSRNVTRLNNVVNKLQYVLEDEKKGKKLGVRGRPVVLPRTILEAAQKKTHPLHIYSDLLVSNVNTEVMLAQRRLANRKLRKVQAAEARVAAERLTRAQRKVERQRIKDIQKKEPRDLAAIRPTIEFNIAKEVRRTGKQPIKKTTRKGGKPRAPPRAPPLDQDALNTLKRHPHHRRRYNTEKKATARLLYPELDSPDSEDNSPPPSCPRSVVLHRYSNYTYFDVTGDGRCYFYSIIKALGLPLYMGVGKKTNTNRFVQAHTYFNPSRQAYWKKELQKAEWHDPIDVLYDSLKMTRALHDRGILYVAKLVRTRRDLSQVHAYMLDPIAQIRHSDSDGIYKIQDDGSFRYIPQLKARLRKNQNIHKTAAFKKAFREGRVVTFVWRNIPHQPRLPHQPRHYEVIIPNRLKPT